MSSNTTTTTTVTDPPITEFIDSSSGSSSSGSGGSVDEIVETLYNTEDVLIGYACKQVLEKNTVEPMDILFYMDVLTPKGAAEDADTSTSVSTPQETAITVSQEFLLGEMSREYQIDPGVSRGVRCFDLPVDGSTWIVQMTIEPRDFSEVTLFGGCRQLEWDPETQDCKFYEAHMKGSYIGAVARGEDGTPFGDTVSHLEELLNGPDLAQAIRLAWEGDVLLIDGENTAESASDGDYQTAFLGVPRVTDDPNFQGADQGRDDLNDPTNIKTGIQSNMSQNKKGRAPITLVGGIFVALFSIVFVLTAYILFKRRKSYRKNNGLPPAVGIGGVCTNDDPDNMRYADLQKQETDGEGDEDSDFYPPRSEIIPDIQPHEDEPITNIDDPEETMTAEAIQMDLGNSLKGQLMEVHAPVHEQQARRSLGMIDNHDETDGNMYANELDETDSWAQTDGTIGSLDLQLEPITAEV